MRAFDQNQLLALLARGELRQLVPDMQDLTLASHSILFEAGQLIDHLYFPLTGIVALVVTGDDGGDVEVATIGNEGVVAAGSPPRRSRRPN